MIRMISSDAIGSASCALPGSPRFTRSPIPLLHLLALWTAEISQGDAKQKTNHLPMHQEFFRCAASGRWMQQKNIVAYFTDRNCINTFLLFFCWNDCFFPFDIPAPKKVVQSIHVFWCAPSRRQIRKMFFAEILLKWLFFSLLAMLRMVLFPTPHQISSAS